MANYGIKETTEFFNAGIALKEAVNVSIANDGKIDFTDFPNFIQFLIQLPEAIKGLDQVPAELGDLNENELDALEQKFGDLVGDDRYRKLFRGLAITGGAVLEIVRGEQEA